MGSKRSVWKPEELPRFRYYWHYWNQHTRNKESKKTSNGGLIYALDSETSKARGGRTLRLPTMFAYLATPAKAKQAWRLWEEAQLQGQPENLVTKHPRPAQMLTISNKVVEHYPNGDMMFIRCSLDQTYPNFRLECEYNYMRQHVQDQGSISDTWFSRADFRTNENLWAILFEWTGTNEDYIAAVISQCGGNQLRDMSDKPLAAFNSAIGGVQAVITVPAQYDLPRMRCEIHNLYEVELQIPSLTFVGKWSRKDLRISRNK